jgi:predicted amidophosphoribosyltransferase
MGYKKVCLYCRKAFNRAINTGKVHISICPQCEKPMTELYHLFQPPKQTDVKKWNVVRYLLENGFKYYHVWEKVFKNEKGENYGTANYAKYS